MKKILLLFITALVIFTCACAGGDTDKPNSGDQNEGEEIVSPQSGSESEEDSGAEIDVMTLIPEQNLGGFELRFLTDIIWDWDFGPLHMMCVEEQTGEPVNDAMYIRNAIVEERLNMTISETVSKNNDSKNMIRKIINAGSDEYDVLLAESWNIGGTLVTADLLMNLTEIPEFSFDSVWWDYASIRDYTIGDKLYFVTGDHNLISNDATWMLFFNKQMVQDVGLDLPYELVRDGKWTFDKQIEYMRAAARDVDGDGIWSYDDIWGQVSHTQHYTGLLFAAGENLITRDGYGMPVFGEITERFYNVYDKIQEIMKSPGYTHNVYVNIPKAPSSRHATYEFLANSALFCPEILAHTRRFRQMESDFGVLPHPKYDEAQQQYYSYVLGQVTVTCIPITNQNLTQTAAVLDALAMLSAHTIQPAYYEISLIGKFFRDDESADMIDIIRRSRVYGIADAYSWGNATNAFQDAALGNAGITSYFEKNEGKINNAIEKTLESFN